MKFSLIAPTYGRPDEVSEFVRSATALAFDPTAFEIILSDGTPRDALRPLVEALQKETSVAVRFLHEEGLPVSEARNWAAKQANGTILLFLDSDCLLPSTYLTQIEKGLQAADWDAFGGPDDAPSDFSPLQKAISFSMTSLWTTGGIRGGKKSTTTYYPRGFNMGMKREVFFAVGGYDVHFKTGEDVDLSIRIHHAGYRVGFIPTAVVWHKRRSTLKQFFHQVRRFGGARLALAQRHPGQLKITHLFPVFLLLGTVVAILLAAVLNWPLLVVFIAYFLFPFLLAGLQYRSAKIGAFAVASTVVMMLGYGIGFLEAFFGGGSHRVRG